MKGERNQKCEGIQLYLSRCSEMVWKAETTNRVRTNLEGKMRGFLLTIKKFKHYWIIKTSITEDTSTKAKQMPASATLWGILNNFLKNNSLLFSCSRQHGYNSRRQKRAAIVFISFSRFKHPCLQTGLIAKFKRFQALSSPWI